MVDEDKIEEWREDDVISDEQAEYMINDLQEDRSQSRSNKVITSLSTIGALFLGIAAILFIASNWEQLSNVVKTFILVGSTGASYYGGYVLRYERQNYPRVGSALLFLGALLFGASVFLIAQIYHVQANYHALILIWLLGVLPMVYVFRHIPITYLANGLFYLWFGFFTFRTLSFGEAYQSFYAWPFLFLSAAILLFSFGSFHYKHGLNAIARIYRLIAVNVAFLSLYVLTYFHDYNAGAAQMHTSLLVWAGIAFAVTLAHLLTNAGGLPRNRLEHGTLLVLLVVSIPLFYLELFGPLIYSIVFNLFFAVLSILLIQEGYTREDITLVQFGGAWLALFVLTKYFDFFWDLLSRSIFFFVGGALLLGGGIWLERKRRELKEAFNG